MKPRILADYSPTCERCRHWSEQTDPGDEARHGECRRHPPVVVVVDDSASSMWPWSGPDENCGDWSAGQ